MRNINYGYNFIGGFLFTSILITITVIYNTTTNVCNTRKLTNGSLHLNRIINMMNIIPEGVFIHIGNTFSIRFLMRLLQLKIVAQNVNCEKKLFFVIKYNILFMHIAPYQLAELRIATRFWTEHMLWMWFHASGLRKKYCLILLLSTCLWKLCGIFHKNSTC